MSAILTNKGCHFSVWAPEKSSAFLHLEGRRIAMLRQEDGWFTIHIENISPLTRYYFSLEDSPPYPDPQSYFQPDGVHGPSAVVDHNAHRWHDKNWRGIPLDNSIFYEVHVGAFTKEGTFDAMIPLLGDIAATGINAIELMPVAQCPGDRNWGYDGTFLYAVQHSYGGPNGLKRFVDACHQHGIAVYIDVVYNHLGQEGNYLPFFGPYFSDKYQTPWGKAFNFDGAWSDQVREYIVGNALYWAEHFHVDGIRLDAIHEIFDRNAFRIWDQLHISVKEWEQRSGRRFYLVGESDLNDPRVVTDPALGGFGLDAQWLDDFHHSMYVLLDEEGKSHYRDYGAIEQLAKAYTEGFVHSGEFVKFRQRCHGASSAGMPGSRFVIFNQNHDLPGNRPGGERLSTIVDLPRLKLAAAAILLAPYIPLLFMGEEYGETSPFYFFSDYSDPAVIEELKTSRKQQFEAFEWDTEAPDPQQPVVFEASKLRWERRVEGEHRILLDWHRQLIRLRQNNTLLLDLSRKYIRTDIIGCAGLAIHRHSRDARQQLLCLLNFSDANLDFTFSHGLEWTWSRVLSSDDTIIPEMPQTSLKLDLPPWAVAVYAASDGDIA